MTLITKDGFQILNGSDNRQILLIKSTRISKSIDYIRKHRYKIVGLSRFHGYSNKRFDFLNELSKNITGLLLLGDDFDLKGLHNLPFLKTLSFVDNGKDIVDLNSFPKLTELGAWDSKRLVGLNTIKTLEDITITSFGQNDFTNHRNLKSVRKLTLLQPKISSMKGIEVFKSLKYLEIFQGRQLASLDNIEKVKSLTNFEIDKCKKIKDISMIGAMKNLQTLRLSDCGDIKSLSFIQAMKNLEILTFVDTNIVDGNLSYCIGLKFVGFIDKKHYSHKFKDFEKTNQYGLD